MMKQPEGVPIQVGNYRTTLPIYKDRTTSEKIVSRLQVCHAGVRDKVVKVDTVEEVLLVAYEFACEVYRLEEEQKKHATELDKHENELISGLSKLLSQVRKTVDSYTPVEEEQDKGEPDGQPWRRA